ncbi:MAG TPA: SpoIIE family protein phosphatase [Candidatus Limnocylindrales bacterium]|nr:SpoIIE family protein phosphatase [Candidatus Limnocylindrales bacterium]
MASDPISGRGPRAAARPRRPVFRYVLLACLFTVTIYLQVQSTIVTVHRVPAHVPVFAPGLASAALEFVDSKAVAAGLHRGDTLLAINNRPYTGRIVLQEARLKATPGSTLAVTVRSAGEGSGERTLLLPVMQGKRLLDSKVMAVSLPVVMAIFCIALGFWVVLVRPNDLSAWLLLGLLMGLAEMFSVPPVDQGWSPGLFKLALGFFATTAEAWVAFMFLFGFYFPEPLPYFTRPGLWRKWLPWIVVAPYGVYALFVVRIAIGDMVDYASVEPLQHALSLLTIPMRLYAYCLVGAFFALIFAKSAIAISADAKRRLRLLYWGAAVALTPLLLVGLVAWVRHSIDFPDWLISIAVLMFLIFPLTLAYVIVVQRAMDVRVVVRQGLRYAVAKNGVRTLQVLAILVVTLTALALIGQNRERPQKIIVIALGLVAIFTIRSLTEKIGAWIDRRFFREAYDAERVLSELSDSVRGMVEARSLIETVAERISETLHIPRVAILLNGVGAYRPVCALGYGAVPDIAFPASAGTVKLLQKESEPARVYFDDPNSWLYREPEMTEEDRSRLTELDAALLLPLSTRDKLLGFISLGPKLSDEPYSRTDLRLLKSVAAQTGLALENAQLISEIADGVVQRERLNREVEIAREVQERLFPQTLPPIAGIAYAGACRSALGVGGDYYDFLALPAGKLGIAIGDVSGKGIAAALMMASLQASLRSEATRASDNLAGMMGNVNRLVYEASSSNRYATFFYGQYDPVSRQLTYVNAGHNPPMLFHPYNGECQVSRLEACGTVVGLLENASYQQADLTITPGDILVAFTDGVSEAMNAEDEEWGEERLIGRIKCCVGLSPTEIISCIMRNADAFSDGAKQNDDMTLVVVCAQPEIGK